MAKTTLRGGEDTINAELRALTDKTRQLREELRELMNHPGARDLSRASARGAARARSGPGIAADHPRRETARRADAEARRRLKRSR
jgi:hypothetical protein